MKTVLTVAAIIRDGDRIFAAQRGYGAQKDGWEFPGGKIEAGETPQQALVREIREELDTGITVGDRLTTIEYDYPAFHLSMQCFWAAICDGDVPEDSCRMMRCVRMCVFPAPAPASRNMLLSRSETISSRSSLSLLMASFSIDLHLPSSGDTMFFGQISA